jgi:DNA-binding NarL/FixJ family response regulator
MRVLLVDDNAQFLKSAQRFLSSMETVAVTVAHDGHEALAHLEREGTDLVLMDLNMPGMSGLEATRRMKALDPRVRVIVVSLHDGPEFRVAAIDAGAENLVAKQDFAVQITPLLAAASRARPLGRAPDRAGD